MSVLSEGQISLDIHKTKHIGLIGCTGERILYPASAACQSRYGTYGDFGAEGRIEKEENEYPKVVRPFKVMSFLSYV